MKKLMLVLIFILQLLLLLLLILLPLLLLPPSLVQLGDSGAGCGKLLDDIKP